MKTKIVKVGNSKGVIIPASFIKECHLKEEVEMEIQQSGIFIKSIQHSSAGGKQPLRNFLKTKTNGGGKIFHLQNLKA
jgi:antitoxin component of MazEF toxin-antitoxin module